MSGRKLRTVGAWALLLWGPTIWFGHFGAVYAAASLELTLRPTAGPASRLAILAATVLALTAVGLAAIMPERFAPGEAGGELRLFWIASTRLLCLISAVAIVYQALPALIVP